MRAVLSIAFALRLGGVSQSAASRSRTASPASRAASRRGTSLDHAPRDPCLAELLAIADPLNEGRAPRRLRLPALVGEAGSLLLVAPRRPPGPRRALLDRVARRRERRQHQQLPARAQRAQRFIVAVR